MLTLATDLEVEKAGQIFKDVSHWLDLAGTCSAHPLFLDFSVFFFCHISLWFLLFVSVVVESFLLPSCFNVDQFGNRKVC